MFTIKLYDGNKQRILEAESFTVQLNSGAGCNTEGPYTRNWAEITLHNRTDDVRYDVGESPYTEQLGGNIYKTAYIENANGKTVASYRYDQTL